MKIVLNGMQFGIVLAFLVGPVFFTLLQTSIEKGFWKGAFVAIGVSLSDILLVLICYFGLVHFVQSPQFKVYMGYLGGGVLIIFGLYYLIIKSRPSKQEPLHASEERKTYRYILKGFMINGLGPSVLIFWIATVSVATLEFGYSSSLEFFLFFSALLATVLGTDILKAYLAGKLRTLVTPRLMMIMNIILGIAMIVFGIRLVYLAQFVALA